nr:hypothetical protein [Tanacetum cinerariifolium]
IVKVTELRNNEQIQRAAVAIPLEVVKESAYAKALIKVVADKELLNSVVVVIPFLKGTRHYLETVNVEYEWKPPSTLREEEAVYVQAFNDALVMEERFLKQKANIKWIKVGDSNTAYFHKAVKIRISRSQIEVVMDSNGVMLADGSAADGYVNHYESFLYNTPCFRFIDDVKKFVKYF